MKLNSRQLKRRARNAMEGCTGILIFSSLMVLGADLLSSQLSSMLFDGESTASLILGMIFEFILNLLVGIFSAGLSYLMLNISRGRDFSYGDLLYFFHNHPDRVIVAGFVLSLLQVISGIPLYIVTYAVPTGTTTQEMLNWMSLAVFATLAGTFINLLLTLPFVLTYYCLADDLELEGFAALKESMRRMKGNKWRYLKLQISFVPILFLSVFTLYLALLWIVPYMEMTCACFYRDILGEYITPDGTGSEGRLPSPPGPGEQGSQPRDDYNSEA